MDNEQQYRLRWNNHPDNMTDVLVGLFHRQQLCDVTLSCHGELIKAHQTVLSACSPLFENMLVNHEHPHPIILLTDVNIPELKAVLEFMYKGEVNVSHNLLTVFLKTADALRVKGLTDNNLLNSAERSHDGVTAATGNSNNSRAHTPPHPHEKRKRKSSNCDTNSNSDSRHNNSQATSSYRAVPLPKSQSERDLESPEDLHSPPVIKQEHPQNSPQHIDYHSMSETLQTGGSLIVHQQDDLLSAHSISEHNEGGNKTPMPPLDSADSIDGSKAWHMRLTFDKLPGGCNLHRCKLCGKIVTHIRNHYHVHFPGRFECPLCRATYTRSDNLRTHCKFKHPRYNPDTRKFDATPLPPAAAAAAVPNAAPLASNPLMQQVMHTFSPSAAAAAAAAHSDLSND